MANPTYDLFSAIVKLDADRVEALLASKRFDVNKPFDASVSSSEPEVPLQTAAIMVAGAFSKKDPRSLKIIDLLLAEGADPNRVYGRTATPLQLAARERPPLDFEVVRKLLLAGADPNKQTSRINATALSGAIGTTFIKIDVLLLLLAFGADPTLKGSIHLESAIDVMRGTLEDYIRGGRDGELRMAKMLENPPPPDKTQVLRDMLTALELPKDRYEELRPIMKRAMKSGFLSEEREAIIREKLFVHDRRRHAVEAWRRAGLPPTSNAPGAATGAGASRRSASRRSAPCRGGRRGGQRKRRNTRRRLIA